MKRYTGLIADDEPLLRERLRSHLAALWPELELLDDARNGAEALELFALHHPDIVFLDIHMPGQNGIDVARLPLTGTRVRYAIDFGKVLACADARGLAGDPMPAGDIALDGVHWYIEGSGTQGSLGLEVSAVETALFVDGFD